MERHGNMKMTVMKEEVGCIHRLLDRRHSMPGSAHVGKPRSIRGLKEWEEDWDQSPFVTSAGMNDPGQASRLLIS